MTSQPESPPISSPDSSPGSRLLAIDIGNTSIAIGVYEGERLAATFRVASDQENLPDEYSMLLTGLLAGRRIEPASVDAAILSSTVPPLTRTFREVCRRSFGVEALVVGPGVRTGIRVRYDNPREVGPDRVLHAVAALHRYEPPLVIVDLGTALVFDAISAEGDYLGGAIAPGVGLASEALSRGDALACVDGAATLGDRAQHRALRAGGALLRLCGDGAGHGGPGRRRARRRLLG